MIKLDIPLFCSECDHIKPIAEQSVENITAEVGAYKRREITTLIKCKHEERCKCIYDCMNKTREKNKLYNEVRKGGGEII